MQIEDEGYSSFLENGYLKFNAYNLAEYKRIKSFSLNWVNSLFKPWCEISLKKYSIEQYHKWFSLLPNKHREILSAENRHISMDKDLNKLILNKTIKQALKYLGLGKYKLWDEGLGNLAFRLIRPNFSDGYPFSCKAWGPAKNVYSIWIPIVGHGSNETINLLPKSHLEKFNKYLPKNTKFCKDEYRLEKDPSPEECFRPEFRPGEVLIFHPRLIHSEDVTFGDTTRFNLEFRMNLA